MNKKILICITSVFLVLLALVAAFIFQKTKKSTTKTQKSSSTMRVSGSNCTIKKIKHTEKKVYSEEYQNEAEQQLENWKQKTSFSPENPLMVWNPYGTNTGSFYYYARSKQESYVECQITPQKGSVLKNRLKNDGEDGVTSEHEYLITGLAPGQSNEIKLSFYNTSDELLKEETYTVQLKEDSKIPAITNVEKGDSTTPLSEGLFAVLGHDKSVAKNIYYYDNDGVSRGRTPIEQYRTDRILTINGNMVYSYRLTDIAIVNRLGKVIKTVNLGKYKLHHDFMYDKKKKVLLCLVNDTKKDTIEDVLISVNLNTGKVKKLVDFEVLLQDMRDMSVQRKNGKNTYGGTQLDWLHLNSLDMINDKDAIFSSREESVLIKIKNIYDTK